MANHVLKYDIDEDFIDASFYLVKGKERTLFIDTGCGEGSIRAWLRPSPAGR